MTSNISAFAYVGCYTSAERKGRGVGISVFSVDAADGSLTPVQLLSEFKDPSFLVLDRTEKYLYCVNASDGQVNAFSVDKPTGQLTWLNTQSTGGVNPVSLCLDPTNRFLLAVNYTSGSVAVLPITSNGSLEPLSDLVQMQGIPGPDKVEQTASHPHDISFDVQGQFVMVPDKGFDKIFVFKLDPENGKLALNVALSATAEPGAGPRHIAFHPTGAYSYVINELGSTITVYSYAPDREILQPFQVISTLPADFKGKNTGAEVKIDPAGKFVYGSNRGHNSIAVYAIELPTGKLSLVQLVSTQGETPRYFTLDPTGNFLYVLNQDSDSLVTFRIDKENGTLTPTGQVIQTGSPVCLAFARVTA